MIAASVVVTLGREDLARIVRMVASVAAQREVECELMIAVAPGERASVNSIESVGAISRVVIVDNPTGRRSEGLNRAVAAAASPMIVRVDARSQLAPDHVRRCVDRLELDPSIAMVGGHQVPRLVATGSLVERGVRRTLANPWLLGGAAYRRPSASGLVDTVYLGAFRRTDVLEAGGFDERLIANEDFDLCHRLRAIGFGVWLEAELDVAYEPRSTVRAVFSQYHEFGRSKVDHWRLRGSRPNARQAAALSAAALVLVTVLVSRRRLRLAAAFASALAVVAVSTGDAAPLAERAASVPSAYAVIGGWVSGVARSFLFGARTATSSAARLGLLRKYEVGVNASSR